jgi:uncharacterized membrane protein
MEGGGLTLIGMAIFAPIAMVWTIVAISGWLMPIQKSKQMDLFDE